MRGVLYDIHGNLPALEAVLAEAAELPIDRWLLGGDYGTPSPWPQETLARLRELPEATWIRGNGERWLLDPPTDRPDLAAVFERLEPGVSDEEQRRLFDLPERAEVDGAEWLPLEEAPDRLAYKGEKEMAKVALSKLADKG